MPRYEYYCPLNKKTVEVKHSIHDRLKTWGEVCKAADISLGETSAKAEVVRLIGMPEIRTPTGNTKLKELGFTKLVKRDKGVYENVTSTNSEKRYVKSDDPSSMPDFKKKIQD